MILKLSKENYLNLSKFHSICLVQQNDKFGVILVHDKGTTVLFTGDTKEKAQAYIDKFIELIKEEIVDG